MKKIWLSTLLKFYAYVMVVILTIMGLVVAGISWKNQQAEADRIAQSASLRILLCREIQSTRMNHTIDGRLASM